MRVLLFGATGMVGRGVLRECLLDARVEHVLSVGRSSLGLHKAKLREALTAAGLREMRYGFDLEGAKVLVNL
jgi:uncharacterized protein YbjT (DUF2867 family)